MGKDKIQMIWNNDFDRLEVFYRQCNEQERAVVVRAVNYARGWFPDAEDDDFIVIRVESFYCIAFITDEFTPIEVSEKVVPFDSEKVYPLQCLEQKVYFKRF